MTLIATTRQAMEIVQMQAYGAPPAHIAQYLHAKGINTVEVYHATNIEAAQRITETGIKMSYQDNRPDATYFFLDSLDIARNADKLGLGQGGSGYAVVTISIPRQDAAYIRDDGLFNGTFSTSYSAARLLRTIPVSWVQKIEEVEKPSWD